MIAFDTEEAQQTAIDKAMRVAEAESAAAAAEVEREIQEVMESVQASQGQY